MLPHAKNMKIKTITRHEFLKLMGMGFIDLLLAALGGIGYSTLLEPGLFKIENVRLELKRLPKVFSGLRIAQISDIHMGGWMNLERFQRVADMIDRYGERFLRRVFTYGENANCPGKPEFSSSYAASFSTNEKAN